MIEIPYLNLAQKILIEKWSTSYKQPLQMNEKDLTAGMVLLTKIAVEAINKEFFAREATSSIKDARKTEVMTKLDTKIKEFIEDKAHAFRKACQTGFPFSSLESPFTKVALQDVLQSYGSILSRFITLVGADWLSEEDLDQRFSTAFHMLDIRAIGEACSDLKRAYLENGDNKAGYYLLWLLKTAGGCSFEIPKKNNFNKLCVTQVLSLFTQSGTLTNAASFVEILHYRHSGIDLHLYQEFLNKQNCLNFLNFTIELLKDIQLELWPNKVDLITDTLEEISHEGKLAFAKALTSSEDAKTSKIGDLISKALVAHSFREAIPHLHALIELLPMLNRDRFESIFGHPFKEFRYDKSIYKNDPDFSKRLHFNHMNKVFIDDSLIIGVYKSRDNDEIPPHLLAYDMYTEKMVWGIALTSIASEKPYLTTIRTSMTFGIPRMGSPLYRLKKKGDFISLQFQGKNNVHLINSKTGELNSTIEMPTALDDCLHISEEGYTYHMILEDLTPKLIGGKQDGESWKESFNVTPSRRQFRAFSTHCGFQPDFENILILFGPTGDQVVFNNCLAAEAKGDKLYLIEKDNDQCLLTVRTLQINHEVVGEVEKCIPLNVKKASFGDLSMNDEWILFFDKFSNKSPLFVDLKSEKVTYSDHEFPFGATTVINTHSGEFWSWDQLSKKIWKVSSTQITMMGFLESGRGTTLLHVDKNDHLYFVDIPF